MSPALTGGFFTTELSGKPWKFLIILEQEAPHFHFALGTPTNYVAIPNRINMTLIYTLWGQDFNRNYFVMISSEVFISPVPYSSNLSVSYRGLTLNSWYPPRWHPLPPVVILGICLLASLSNLVCLWFLLLEHVALAAPHSLQCLLVFGLLISRLLNSPSEASKVHEPRTSRCSSWI